VIKAYHPLTVEMATLVTSNLSTMGMPVGLAFNFTINGSPFVIPMAIEEPSVVAAVSSAAKTISTYQGFQAWAPERNMIVAQVQLLDILDDHMDTIMNKMKAQEEEIKTEANEYCTNMVLRGGGVQRVTFHRVRRHRQRQSFKGQDLLVKYGVISDQSLPSREESLESGPSATPGNGQCSEWLVVHLHVDVGDAMGANCANTVAEGIAPFLAKMSGGRIGVRILSNLNVDRIAKVNNIHELHAFLFLKDGHLNAFMILTIAFLLFAKSSL
jgi:hydroxymethylglutaryl-CoA reductase